MKVSNILISGLLLSVLFLNPNFNYAQTELVEVDSVSKQFNKIVPIDKPFTVKYKIEKGNVVKILIIEKGRGSFLESSIKPGKQPSIDEKYWSVRKEGKSSYLYINFAEDYLFKPGDSYFIIPIFEGIVSEDVFNYFEAINSETKIHGSDVSKIYSISKSKHIKYIKNYEKEILSMVKDSTILGTITSSFLDKETNFKKFLNDKTFSKVNEKFDSLKLFQKIVQDNIMLRSNNIISNFPNFSFLTNAQISENTTIKDDAVQYLLGINGEHNSFLNILHYSVETDRLNDILFGLLNVNCISCKKLEASSLKQEIYEKRISNLDTLFKNVFKLRALYHLLKPKMVETEWKSDMIRIDNFLSQINKNREDFVKFISKRKDLDQVLFSERYVGYSFFGLDILSGNSIMSFEARNKLTLGPEFGVVTSAFNKKGKDLEYGIIPYLGFSINFMGVNKDVKYNSYNKDWRQKWSFSIGWALVNLNKEAERASFFEKGSMLTGLSFRINNTIKATSGVQMYFDLSKDNVNNEIRKLVAVPYIGLSFDLFNKELFNGFLDIIPGTGKTKNISSANNNY